MPAPATFRRRAVAYSLDLAAVSAIAFPLVLWQLRPVPAAFDAAIAAVRDRLDALVADAFNDLGGLPGGGSLLGLATQWARDPVLRAPLEGLADTLLDATLASLLATAAVAAVWFVGFEASARQATPGKAALGLRVVAADGGPVGLGRAMGRFVAGAPSWALLHLGHAVAAWRADGRAVHDLLAGTRVEQEAPRGAPLPAWARAWVFVLAAALCGAVGWGLARYAALLGEFAAP